MNTTFGLDIGSASIKIAWLSENKEQYTLQAASLALTPTGGMASESQLDIDQVVKTIRDLVSESRVQTRFVNMSIPEQRVYTKVIELPTLNDQELSSAIYWEAEQY